MSFRPDDLRPTLEAVLRQMGMRSPADLLPRHRTLLDAAFDGFARLAEPVAIVEEVPRQVFDAVFPGDGLNDHEAPLAEIYPQADALVLFAATLGEPVSARIGQLFAEGDAPAGFVLDALASVAADRLSDRLAERVTRQSAAGTAVLPYSPGYCGWHITAQRALFARLRPGDIGMRLNDSCLMQPLKSVSGVLVAGSASIHQLRPAFSFCAACATRQCVRRMASVHAAGPSPAA